MPTARHKMPGFLRPAVQKFNYFYPFFKHLQMTFHVDHYVFSFKTIFHFWFKMKQFVFSTFYIHAQHGRTNSPLVEKIARK